jgi:hypothetical protein
VAWGRADPGANCVSFVEANASGHCDKTTAGVWANYDTDEFTILSGTITEVVWTSPHVWLYMEGADAQGRPQNINGTAMDKEFD